MTGTRAHTIDELLALLPAGRPAAPRRPGARPVTCGVCRRDVWPGEGVLSACHKALRAPRHWFRFRVVHDTCRLGPPVGATEVAWDLAALAGDAAAIEAVDREVRGDPHADPSWEVVRAQLRATVR